MLRNHFKLNWVSAQITKSRWRPHTALDTQNELPSEGGGASLTPGSQNGNDGAVVDCGVPVADGVRGENFGLQAVGVDIVGCAAVVIESGVVVGRGVIMGRQA